MHAVLIGSITPETPKIKSRRRASKPSDTVCGVKARSRRQG